MKFLKLLAFQDSRKVAFGLWLFLASCGLLISKLITSADWSTAMILCATMIGGGTVADRFMAKKSEDSDKDVPRKG